MDTKELFENIFSELIFTRREIKDRFYLYVARVGTNSVNSNRLIHGRPCVIVFVPDHMGIHSEAKLNQLSWQNIQTRLIKTNKYDDLRPQRWKYPNDVQDVSFVMITRERTHTDYTTAKNMKLRLIHDTARGAYQHYSQTSLSTALHTFYCCVTLEKQTTILPSEWY